MDTRTEVVRLHLEGQSYNQIAKRLKITRGTVGGHLKRWRDSKVWEKPVFVETRRDPFLCPGKAYVAAQIAADEKFRTALAHAFRRGDHLPAAQGLAA